MPYLLDEKATDTVSDEDYCTLLFLPKYLESEREPNQREVHRSRHTSGKRLALIRASKIFFEKPSKDIRRVYDSQCEWWL